MFPKPVYSIIKMYIEFRYRLIPYILSGLDGYGEGLHDDETPCNGLQQ